MSLPQPVAHHAPRETSARSRILDAAEHLMGERGYAATGIAAISQRSGLPASSIYWHFGNKQGLLAAVMERGAMHWLHTLQQALDEPSDTPPLRTLLDHSFTSLQVDPPEFLRLLILLALERSHTDSATLEMVRNIRELGRRALESAMEQAFSDLAPELAGELAKRCSSTALAFAEGCYVAYQIDPANTDIRELSSQLEFTVLAMARELLNTRLDTLQGATRTR